LNLSRRFQTIQRSFFEFFFSLIFHFFPNGFIQNIFSGKDVGAKRIFEISVADKRISPMKIAGWCIF